MPAPTVILTEGLADDIFIENLIGCSGLDKNKFFVPHFDQSKFGGISNFWKKIRSIRSTTEPYFLKTSKAIIIIADNDHNPEGQFKEIQNQIVEANKDEKPDELFGIPQRPRESAQQSTSIPPIFVLMLPWDNENGCLETICIQSANKPKYKHELECVEQFAGSIGTEKWVEPSKGLHDIARSSKFRVKSLLTCICTDPYTPFHSAWNPKKSPMDIFDLKDTAWTKIVEFLKTFTP